MTMNLKGLIFGLLACFISEIIILFSYNNLQEFAVGFGIGVFIFLMYYFIGFCIFDE